MLDPKVYHHLRLIRLIMQMKREAYDGDSWWSEMERIDGSFFQPESALQLCHIELQRQLYIAKFLHPMHPLDTQILSQNHIMNHFLTLQVDFSIENYETLKNLFSLNHRLNQQQFAITHDSKASPKTEVNLLNEYMIVKLYLNIIQSPEPSQEFLDVHLRQIRALLKTINDGKILFQLLQNVFTLLFLRFEHIRKTKRKRKNSETRSGSNSNQNNSHTTDVSDATADTLKNGFVCLKTSLKAVLNSMRLFLMGLDQMKVYETCDDDLKGKFVEMLKNVDNTLWRLRIVDNDGEKKKSQISVKEWVTFHRVKTASVIQEVTSDDENNAPKKKVNRKKLKKRPMIAAKTDDNDEASDDPIEFQLMTETSMDISEVRTQSRSTESQKRIKSVITKVLMSPESLVSMCMLKGDDENVQKIVKVSVNF